MASSVRLDSTTPRVETPDVLKPAQSVRESDEGTGNAGENPVVLNVTMILLLFGLMGLGWMREGSKGLPRAVIVQPPGEGRTIVDSMVGCLDPMETAGIHGPPLTSRGRPQPVRIRTFG